MLLDRVKGRTMATSLPEITEQLLSLPAVDRAKLAQTLWESLDRRSDSVPREVIAEAKRRDAELESGKVAPCSHEQVMQAARRAIQCTSVGTTKHEQN
jgi:putative addiction module component (TIGR02574 family)